MLLAKRESMLTVIDNPLLLGQNVGYLVNTLKVCEVKDLAAALTVTPAAIGQLINGQTKGWKPINLVKAARFFGVPAELLVTVDFRAHPELPPIVQAHVGGTLGVLESPPGYMTGSKPLQRLRVIVERLTLAAIAGQLTTTACDYLERTVDMLLQPKAIAGPNVLEHLAERTTKPG